MRLLPVSVLLAFFSSVAIAQAAEKPLGISSPIEVPTLADETPEDDGPAPTIFNGVEVPPLPNIDGEKFDTTVKDGYWFVKHHSWVESTTKLSY
jgi:protein disulfide-isomerase